MSDYGRNAHDNFPTRSYRGAAPRIGSNLGGDPVASMRAFISTGPAYGALDAEITALIDIQIITKHFIAGWRPGMKPSSIEFFRVAFG